MFKNNYLPLLTLMILFTACASKSSDRYREGDNSGQQVDMTVDEEKQLTKEALAQMSKEYPPAKNPAMQSYIERLGQKLVAANNLNHHPYTYNFTVTDVPAVNAFALPAGTVYITTPIIAMAESEAELAGVIGHEIGHVTARHTAERMYIAKKEQGKTWLFGGVGAALGGVAGWWLGGKVCKEGDTACKAKYTMYGLGGGAAGGLLVQKYGFMANSREDELESDRVGFKYAVNAGYNKEKIGDFYKKLLAMENASKKGNGALGWLADAMSSHPPSAERVKQSEELKNMTPQTGGIDSTNEFFEMRRVARSMVEKHKQKTQN